MINSLILNFHGKSTEREIYQLILSNLNEMIIVTGENPELLKNLKYTLKEALALTENREYRARQREDR